jgi:hypothetical protein
MCVYIFKMYLLKPLFNLWLIIKINMDEIMNVAFLMSYLFYALIF